MRLSAILIVVAMAAGCSGSGGTGGPTSGGPAPTTTTIAEPRFDAAAEDDATSRETELTGYPLDAFGVNGLHESPGYSCEQTDSGWTCPGITAALEAVLVGHDEAQSNWTTDFIDLWPITAIDPALAVDATWTFINGEAGHGLRIVPLDESPVQMVTRPERFLEVTVSAVSAQEFAGRPPEPAELNSSFSFDEGEVAITADRSLDAGSGLAETSMVRFNARTDIEDPLRLVVPVGSTDAVTELVLVETTEQMMQWIVGLRHDVNYSYQVRSWEAEAGSGGLQVRVFETEPLCAPIPPRLPPEGIDCTLE